MTLDEYYQEKKCRCCGKTFREKGIICYNNTKQYCLDCSIQINKRRAKNVATRRKKSKGPLVCIFCGKLIGSTNSLKMCSTCRATSESIDAFNATMYKSVAHKPVSRRKRKRHSKLYSYARCTNSLGKLDPDMLKQERKKKEAIKETAPITHKILKDEGTGREWNVEIRGSGNFYCR